MRLQQPLVQPVACDDTIGQSRERVVVGLIKFLLDPHQIFDAAFKLKFPGFQPAK